MKLINKKNLALLICILFITLGFSTLSLAENTPQPQIINAYDMRAYDSVITELFAVRNKTQIKNDKLIDFYSGYFLGKPYVLGALGEGTSAPFDQQPLYRTDVFDCETFVDLVLALVNARDTSDFNQKISAIRYADSQPVFEKRNHFTNVDWNFHNERKGYLVDVTKQLFPDVFQRSLTLIDKPNWFHQLPMTNLKLLQQPTSESAALLLQSLHHLGDKKRIELSVLTYVPLTALFDKEGRPNAAMFARIPDGTVIEVVRPNWDLKQQIGTKLDISHMGLGLWVNGTLIFREASLIEHKVIDIPLADYLHGYLGSPTIKGIHIEKIKI